MAKNPLTWRNVASTAGGGGGGNPAAAFRGAAVTAFETADRLKETRTNEALRGLLADGEITAAEVGQVQGNVDLGSLLKTQQDVTNSQELSASRAILNDLNTEKLTEAQRLNSPEYLAQEEEQRRLENERAQAQLDAQNTQNSIAQSREERLLAEAEREAQAFQNEQDALSTLGTRTDEIFQGFSTALDNEYAQAIERKTTELKALPSTTDRDIEVATELLMQEKEVERQRARVTAGVQAFGELSSNPQFAQYIQDTTQAGDYEAVRNAGLEADALTSAATEVQRKNRAAILKPTKGSPSSAAIVVDGSGNPSMVSSTGAKENNSTTKTNTDAYAEELGVDPGHPEYRELIKLARGNLSALKQGIADAGGKDFDLLSRNDIENFKAAKENVRRYAAISEGYAEALSNAQQADPTGRKRLVEEVNDDWANQEYINEKLAEQDITPIGTNKARGRWTGNPGIGAASAIARAFFD